MTPLPASTTLTDEQLMRELLWRQRTGATGTERYRELSVEHARRLRAAPDRAVRDALVTPLACGLTDASRPEWVPVPF